MEELSYSEAEKEAIDVISKNETMVLATSLKNHVTARSVSIINKGLQILFQTDKEFIKCRQIKENPNVALCIGNIQIEGMAEITCHPLKNSLFIEKYRKSHESAYKKYSHINDNVIIKVQPRLITFWKYDYNHKPYRDFLNVTERKAYREYYDKN